MDFLSLENAHLLQGKEPYYGYGWSSGNSKSTTVGVDVDGGGSITGSAGVVGSLGAVYGTGAVDRRVVGKMPTPLDPLLKSLKREYASSAGPQDVLASAVGAGELEFLSQEALRSAAAVATGEQYIVEPAAETGKPDGLGDITETGTSWAGGVAARAETPLASGSGAGGRSHPNTRAPSTASLYSPEQPYSPSHSTPHAQRQKQRRALLPAFCRSPVSHVDNLLKATPHLRHLNEASTDMSGLGVYDDSKNVFANMLSFNKSKKGSKTSPGTDGSAGADSGGAIDYHTSLLRQRANRRASLELASFMRLLSNEMPQDQFAGVESEVYAKVFSLVHSKAMRADDRLAGVAALDALLSVPSADEERRAIRFGNNLSSGLKSAHSDYEFLHAVARALGRMAAGASNVDRVEFEIGRSLEWLRSERSDRRLAAALVLQELARCAPTAFYSRTQNAGVHHPTAGASSDGIASHLAGLGATNDFLDHIFPALRDPQPIVRVCAADALRECLNILMDRQRYSMTAPLCTLFTDMMEGLEGGWGASPPGGGGTTPSTATAAVHAHGSLLVVDDMIRHAPNFLLPRFDEVCASVLRFSVHELVLIRLEVVRLIPNLAGLCPEVFGRRYLRESLDFLISSAAGSASAQPTRSRIDLKPTAFMSLGQLALAMSDEELGGGDIMVPTVRILANELDSNLSLEEEEDSDFEYHTVELNDESDFQARLGDIFGLVNTNLKSGGGVGVASISQTDLLGCISNFVEALGAHAAPYVMEIVDGMFDSSGLSEDLIRCLHSIARSVPSKQLIIQRKLFEHVSFCLAGRRVDLFSMRKAGRPKLADMGPSLSSSTHDSLSSSTSSLKPTLVKSALSSMSLSSMTPGLRPKKPLQGVELETRGRAESSAAITTVTTTQTAPPIEQSDSVVINTSTKSDVVDKLVLGLRTLRTIGESYMRVLDLSDGNEFLPFLRNVISEYFSHPSSDVRREAAITCSLLLLPFGEEKGASTLRFRLGSVSGALVEEILQKLLRMAVSDSSPVVRLCVVWGLDERYDAHLSLSLLSPLFLMLEDEALAIRARALQILGRLSRLNPAPILPGLRQVLTDLIIELRCGGDDGGGREVATRLIICFLQEEALQGLTRPFIPSIIDALPLANVAPRLATASLEALGEVATVAHSSINPWLRRLIAHILDNIQEQNSSKQRVSLWALGKIAYGTSYVVTPYLDYPKLLAQAADILPTTKKASWDLRREVFRTFGILGALDPDRFPARSTARTGGGKGGGYFVELEDERVPQGTVAGARSLTLHGNGSAKRTSDRNAMRDQLSSSLQDQTAPSAHAEQGLLMSSSGLPKDAGSGSRPKNIYKGSDNDEPAHLYMYEQYAMTSQPLSQLSPAKRLLPSDEAFYPTVAVQALMRILKDSSLSFLHGMVMKAVMFIFNALGLKSVPFLKPIVPHILVTVKNCGQHGLREALLQQVANLSAIVREHLRPYLPAIFEVVEEFWSTRHLSALCSLVERVAAAVPDDFREYVPLLVRQILASVEAVDITPEWSVSSSAAGDIERLELILRHIQGIKGVLGEYIHLVVPALVKLTDQLVNPDDIDISSRISPPSGSGRSRLAVETVETLSILLQSVEVNPTLLIDTSVKSNSALPARVVQPFLRLLDGKDVLPNVEVGDAIVACLCICVRQLGAGRWMSFYHDTARDAISTWQTKVGIERFQEDQMAGSEHLPIDLYVGVVDDLSANRDARWGVYGGSSGEDMSGSDFSLGRSGTSDVSLSRLAENLRANDTPSIQPIPAISHAHRTNLMNLQKAWDVSQRSTREDWDEWMRRFSVQLLREAPSPALRACAELAQAYQPLARELFSAAFVCCWSELNEQYRANLVFSLQVVFSADASLEILQLLLNLAEFMEHDFEPKGKVPGLSIDISVLAELALKCRAYARALHYKEREYIKGRGGSCVEQLIDINKKLDLPEAALGVLKAAKIEIERRGGRSLVSSHNPNRAESRSEKTPMAYSVITSYGDADLGSWDRSDGASWLAKLGSWAEAVAMYEEKLRETPNDVDSILGCMRCYDARGEWQQALDLAGRSWHALSEDQSTESDLTSWQASTATNRSSADNYRQALKYCAESAWRLSKWDDMDTYSTALIASHANSQTQSTDAISSSKESALRLDYDSAFYRAVLHVHRAEWDEASKNIDLARRAMDSGFTALLAESYKRAYPSMVSAQELSELEEIISFRQFEMRRSSGMKLHEANRSEGAREHLLDVWRQRLDGCRVDAEVHSSILAVRSLVLGPTDEVDATITLSALSRQAEAFRLAERTLLDPLARMGCSLNSPVFGVGIPSNLGLGIMVPGESMERIVNGDISVDVNYMPHHEQFSRQLFNEAGGESRLFIQQQLYFAYIKHIWAATDRKDEAMTRLGLLCNVVDLTTEFGHEKAQREGLRVNAWLRYGDWKLALTPPGSILSDSLATEVLMSYKRANDADVSSNYRAYHSWALINFRLAEQICGKEKDKGGGLNMAKLPTIVGSHVIAAVKGFVRAISVGTKRWSASVQQDLLNLLSCLFKYGELQDVASTINEGLSSINIEAWLGVLPQLLARIHIKSPSVRSVLHPLLVRLGAKHPQALMYPLSVLLKSPVIERKVAAESLMNSLKAHSSLLVEEALMVSSELIRVAILWLELWHEGLEDASRLYYGEGNVSAMLDVLVPLHTQVEKGASTRREQDFLKAFGRDLLEAHNHIKEYVRLITSSGQPIPTTGGFMSPAQNAGQSGAPANAEAEAALNQAWDLYYTVFRRINKQLPGMTTLELNECSPALHNARNLSLGVPGSYRVDGSYVKIQHFIPDVQVITSKQRPRKITIRGNDGKDYVFLLKGHEDLRQDERVMQLFGLVNALLARDRRTNKHDLNIQRYAIAPLSHNAGVVGWVPHCDTLHCLIRDYRETMKIPLNAENREMMALAPNYDSLTALQKVEIFTEALERTAGKGNDLYEVLWIKSTNSEEWLERRTNFTRSLAVMSMVGYILGLGDRHPSNLMLDQISGRVLHIDFGDCFEVAMHREKFPEKVPFRLTRMLTRAMEVSGIEGSYRSTCERTMSVLRDNKDSLVAMLEAFVYDPLISWRLLNQSSGEVGKEAKSASSTPKESPIAESSTPVLDIHTPISHTVLPEAIKEEQNEDGDDEEDEDEGVKDDEEGEEDVSEKAEVEGTSGGSADDESTGSQTDASSLGALTPVLKPPATTNTFSTSHAKSLKMYSEMRALAANLSTSSRIASITGGTVDAGFEQGSVARSRIDKSVRQRELLSMLDENADATNDEALNERALKVIRRVQDKLTGTDFHSPDEEVGEPLDVQEQVQRLIVQATSSENLCQLFIGWCAFW